MRQLYEDYCYECEGLGDDYYTTEDGVEAWRCPECPFNEGEWIPCSERLPEPNQTVLVSINGEVDADWIAVDSTGYGSWYRCMKDVMSVDAWMPLPEPYGGEQK